MPIIVKHDESEKHFGIGSDACLIIFKQQNFTKRVQFFFI